MELETHIAAVRREGELLAAAVKDLEARVPACPDWMVRDLVRHQGEVHRWARSHVATARRTIDGETDFRTFPPDDAGLLAWYAEGLADLVATLEEADAELDCVAFLPGPRGTRFWARRQAHETAIHRVDAESVSGDLTLTTPEFAADGIDEVLYGFFARRPSRLHSPEPLSFALRATDLDRSWLVRIGSDGASTSDGGGDAAGTVAAPAFDLYLLLWNRRPLDGLDISGDRSGPVFWREHAHVSWG